MNGSAAGRLKSEARKLYNMDKVLQMAYPSFRMFWQGVKRLWKALPGNERTVTAFAAHMKARHQARVERRAELAAREVEEGT